MEEKKKRNMRFADEKLAIVLESFEEGRNKTCRKYNIRKSVLGS